MRYSGPENWNNKAVTLSWRCGVQARLIKRSVRIPLVEITVTPQELASVMLDLKEELELDCPRIGLIGFPNMFSDTSQFNRLLHIDLRLYMAEQEEQLEEMVDKALQDGCNAVIGGNRSAPLPGRKRCPTSLSLLGRKVCAMPLQLPPAWDTPLIWKSTTLPR